MSLSRIVCLIFLRFGTVILEFIVSERQGTAFLSDDYGANRAWGHCLVPIL